jgi:anaerobic C4-dicarboxylate transporter
MDRSMTGRRVEGIPILSAAGVGVASLAVVLAVPPGPKPAVLVAPAVVVAILGTVMAPSPQG